jgi:hypothetical protein
MVAVAPVVLFRELELNVLSVAAVTEVYTIA